MSKDDSNKKALIVSVSNYKYLEDLEFCKNDGEMVYNTLTKLGYEIPENRKLVGTVDDITLRKAIVDFFREESVNTTDTLLFYFSGHGVLDGYEGRYFATSNINASIPEENGISFYLLTQQMDRSHSLKTIALLDCCFSGAAVPGVTGKGGQAEEEAEKLGREALSKQFKNSKGKCILASSLSQRRSYNLPEKKMSAFTYFVVEGLNGKKDSVDKNGYVTPEKLDEYVYTKLVDMQGPGQTPVRNLSISGRISLAYYPQLAQSDSAQQENQDNSNFGFWTDVRNRIKSSIDEIEKNPVIDDFAKSAIQSVPVVGMIFVKLYENGAFSEEENTEKILKILNTANHLEENQLEQFCRNLQKYRTEIFENADSLNQLSLEPLSIISKPETLVKSQPTIKKFEKDVVSAPSQNISSDVHPQVELSKNTSELYEEGVSLFMDKKFEDAAKIFDQIYELDSNFIDAVRFKGRSLAAMNRHKAALYYLDRVLNTNPNDIVVLFLKASSLLAQKRPHEAIECYDKIIRIQPENRVATEKKAALENSLPKR